jgi:hypothetical protein
MCRSFLIGLEVGARGVGVCEIAALRMNGLVKPLMSTLVGDME